MSSRPVPSSLAGGMLMTMHRFSQGGADRVGVLLANGFAAAGIATEIALLRSGGEGEAALLALLDPRVSLTTAGPPMGSRHLELVRGGRFVARRIGEATPALVLASSNNMGLVTGLVARSLDGDGPRFAMKMTNPVVRPEDRGVVRTAYRRRLYRFVLGGFDRVLTLSEAERDTLSRMYPALAGRFRTTANAYIAGEMSGGGRRASDPRRPHLVTAARMMPQKRLDRLLRAFARVRTPGARLTILGDGPERARLEQLARALGIAGRVAMLGFQPDVVPWLASADLFLLSSDYEGLPAALIEALACNVPVVTTDCFDGAQTLLAGAAGCAVVPRSAAALAAAIDASLAAPDRGTDLRALARPYSIEASVADHLAALRPLIEGR